MIQNTNFDIHISLEIYYVSIRKYSLGCFCEVREGCGWFLDTNYGFFGKLVDKWDVREKRQQLTSQSLDVGLMVTNDGWQTHHHHQLSLL